MESCDSSPNYIRATSSFDAKKENSPGGSDCEDMISVSSSTCGIRHTTGNNKTVSNFGSVRSFRRRAKSRFVRSSVTPLDDTATPHSDSVAGSSESSPHYLKATSCSEGKKMHSPQHKSLQALSRTSSLRSVRILIKKTSFKPRRGGVKVSEDVAVDRATYSSILKDSKFPEPVEIHNGGTELEKMPGVRVCRYHHCSLHGHCHGSHDPVPTPKRFLYKRRRTLKKQKSIILKTESSPGAKDSSGRKKNLQKSQIVPIVETLDRERVGDGITFSGVETENDKDSYAETYAKQESRLFGDGYDEIRELGLIEIAFGETSFPERSYSENLDILRKYSTPEQEFGGPSFGANGYCFRCSCHIKEQVTSAPRQADADLTLRRVASSRVDDGYKSEVPQNGDTNVLDSSPSALVEKPKEQVGTDVEDNAALDIANEASNKVCPETPVISNEATRKNSMFSSASDSNSDEEGNITTESTSSRDSTADGAMQIKDSETNSPTHEGSKLQFSKRSHMSMWNLIHQHMSSNVAAESAEKQLQRADGESPVDGSDSHPAKESSTSGRELPDSDMGTVNEDSEIQDIEVRKLFAIKLVREAIEKILLPEVQDQTSDDQSITGENTPQPEIIGKNKSEREQLTEKNQSEVCVQENDGETNAHKGDGDVSSNPKEESHMTDDASGQEIKETDDASCPKITESSKKVVSKSEKKAPKHWSNLKKWILLQRFIRELEKVRKFNPRKPRHLPQNPDPEAEKVNLRPQTVDERKNAEEWMLDYALRQAVGQLAPTQKRKVALLVKAFETVVPTQEDPQVQFRIPRLNSNGSDICSTSYKADHSVSDGHGRSKENVPVDKNTMLNQEIGAKSSKKAEKLYDSNDNSGESLVKSQSSAEKRTGMFTSIMKSVLSSSKEENPRETAGGHKDANVFLKSEYLNGEFMPSNRNIKREGSESENEDRALPTESLILDGNGKSAATERTLGPASHPESLEKYMADETETEAIPAAQGLQEDARSDRIEGQTKHSGRSSTETDRKNHVKMWHMIYQHVVSGIAERVGNQLLDGADDDKEEDNKSPAISNGDHPNEFSQSTDESSEKDHVPSNLSGGFTKSDALKLIKEAVDEILLPEIQDDSSDTQSVTSESISDQDFLERNCSDIGGQNFSTEDGVSTDEEGKSLIHDTVITQDETKAEPKVSKKSHELPKAKNWSKLKKLILLKRSIKALEKARKLKPQPHQSSPQTADPEPEKIDLKRQMMDERKKAEQWMLDYAVQHIVTKLTPARKRRVSMLVEAFEAVVPLPEM
ncbi:Calmodulin binding protein PICBP [Sesamum alatum]|uniref:Calmodulin binding protein PICBP n=1 Tax=Sesamum alatum TaxID=300844 RepID=A0AAE2C8H0_9LAMI|nr:Calmodulin binding protein PICBP [Sesamum alatum]